MACPSISSSSGAPKRSKRGRVLFRIPEAMAPPWLPGRRPGQPVNTVSALYTSGLSGHRGRRFTGCQPQRHREHRGYRCWSSCFFGSVDTIRRPEGPRQPLVCLCVSVSLWQTPGGSLASFGRVPKASMLQWGQFKGGLRHHAPLRIPLRRLRPGQHGTDV
mgnify:CR=1 FL=1